jgi:putative Mn2+ efflux pump MntP
MVYCSKCGAQNSDEADNCEDCGSNLRSPSLRKPTPSSPVVGIVFGSIIIFIGVISVLGRYFGTMMGNWGESFGEYMGNWGENVGRFFAEWGTNYGQSFGAMVLILIGLVIVFSQYNQSK